MNNISFLQVVPEVFASADNHDSEIWDAEATFRKGDLYLVEAATFSAIVVTIQARFVLIKQIFPLTEHQIGLPFASKILVVSFKNCASFRSLRHTKTWR